ncbi:hypothetical protein [Kocuria sp. NPDC057446]|uniref:hypothetical protein n=1 Tax=Kocuria sp. NPDC057446 TaxID=3346137 RepID=UPI00367F6BD1
MDAQLARLLNSSNHDEETEKQLWKVLTAYDATREFSERVLRDAPHYRPPGVLGRKRRQKGGFQLMPGFPQPVEEDEFVCPQGNDYTWYRDEVGEVIPQCPVHHCVLVQA